MVTIKDIAQLAGVSPTTVSNVLNGNTARMSDKTKDKVEAILKEQNYAPNMAAHILGQNRSRIVGVIMFMEPRRNESVLEDPFSSTLLGSIEAELRHKGYYMMVHTTSDEQEVLRLSKAWKLSGLILTWVPHNIIPALIESVTSPLVFIDSFHTEKERNFCSVGLKDAEGAFEMASYLCSMGHRTIAYLANSDDSAGTDHVRFKGIQKALEKNGGGTGDVSYITLSRDQEERYSLLKQIASPFCSVTALVFCSDYHAAEAISFYHQIAVSIPDDISITGFDDNVFSRISYPRITTVHQDVEQKGHHAVELLFRMIHGESGFDAHIQLPTRLVIRDSVKKI